MPRLLPDEFALNQTMGGNRFLDPFVEFDGEAPRRLYTRIDQINEQSILLDAIDADWFDGMGEDFIGFDRWRQRSHEVPVYVVELGDTGPATFSYFEFARQYIDAEFESPWFQMMLDGRQADALLYHNLFSDGRPIAVGSVGYIDHNRASKLNESFSLSDYIVTGDDIERALQRLTAGIEWIAVYDVGQGSANGLCDAAGVPLAYFDLGGGVLKNAGTFSGQLSNICVTASPPVILSHWDWDHWSSGCRFPHSLRLDWIVPDQNLGAVHAVFAASILNAGGNLMVWPSAMTKMAKAQLLIHKCSGNGRNHSGLAIEVDGPNGELPILLPGDARYNVIATAASQFASVVVPHHGADMRNASTPICPGLAYSRAAYSYGEGNSFSHPRNITEQRHQANGWPHASQGGMSVVDRHTSALRPTALGHIGLSWDARQPIPIQPCRGLCSLQFRQR